MSSSSTTEPEENPIKTSKLSRPPIDRYVPPYLSIHYAEPMTALRFHVDALLKIGAAAEQLESLQKMPANSVKKNSLRRTQTVNPAVAASKDLHLRSQLLRTYTTTIMERLEHAALNLTAFIVRTAQISDQLAIDDILSIVTYFLVDPTISVHSELHKLNLVDNSLIIAVGQSEMKKQILKKTLEDGGSMKLALKRYSDVDRYSSVWLLEACNNNAGMVASILPIIWLWDNEKLEPLGDTDLQPQYERGRRDLPFLIIGILDLLGFADKRDEMIRKMYRTFF